MHFTRYSFCKDAESSQHLFFTCSVACVIRRTVVVVLRTDLCPNNRLQYYSWCYYFLPGGEKFYIVSLAAITWAIWNGVTFECKMIKTPFEISFSACSFLIYRVGLQKEGGTKVLRTGAELLHSNTINLMRICEAAYRGGAKSAR